jgi:hypothetical protein
MFEFLNQNLVSARHASLNDKFKHIGRSKD